MRNSRQHWGAPARGLHWLMALLILVQWVLGRVGHEMARSPAKLDVLVWHKSIGIALLLVVAARLAWRLANPTPEHPPSTPRWETRAAALGHAALYLLMFAIPLSGWLMNSAKNIPFRVFWLLPWPNVVPPNEALGEAAEELHEALAVALVLVLLVHVAAALRHHFILRDDVLRRMLRDGRD
jgi:cytochrome b561